MDNHLSLPAKSHQTQIFLFSSVQTPLGRLSMVASKPNNAGIEPHRMRTLSGYALVYLLEGSGIYRDGNGVSEHVRSGDLLLLFPGLPHFYAPGRDEYWHEFHLIFDGPAFDLWQQQGLLDPSRPILHLEPVEEWLARLQAVYAPAPPDVDSPETLMIARLLQLLTEIVLRAAPRCEPAESGWLEASLYALEESFHLPLRLEKVAQAAGMPLETFRKRFGQAMNISPMRYRMQKRVEAARLLLEAGVLSNKEIARTLGFTDESHFAARFKRATGQTPREFRRERHLATLSENQRLVEKAAI